MLKKQGWDGLPGVYKELPQSTEQILHFDKYLAHEMPVKVHVEDGRRATERADEKNRPEGGEGLPAGALCLFGQWGGAIVVQVQASMTTVRGRCPEDGRSGMSKMRGRSLEGRCGSRGHRLQPHEAHGCLLVLMMEQGS